MPPRLHLRLHLLLLCRALLGPLAKEGNFARHDLAMLLGKVLRVQVLQVGEGAAARGVRGGGVGRGGARGKVAGLHAHDDGG